MSVENVAWVFRRSPYKLAARLVHLALADAANEDNGNLVWTSQKSLADKAGVSRQSVNEIMRRMVDDGWLVPASEAEARAIRSMMRDARTGVFRFVTCQESRQVDDTTCRILDADVSESRPGVVLPTQGTQGAIATEPGSRSIADLFDEFWKAYPARGGVRRGKAKSLDLFKRLKPADRERCLIACRNYAASDDAKRGFAKDPERFLKARWWEDWVDASGPSSSVVERGYGDWA